MNKGVNIFLLLVIFILSACSGSNKIKGGNGWVSLFDGKTLDGWRPSDNKETFKVENGTIKMEGPRSHLFYEGSVNNHKFKNFEFKATVMTMPKANSGIYFHTEYQEKGFPKKGYEVQVNNSSGDKRRTGGLYGIQDVMEVLVKDSVWFTEHIIVNGKNITIKVNDKTVVEYTEPDNADRRKYPGRLLSSGTFALQGHDPKSVAFYKDIMVKPLPD